MTAKPSARPPFRPVEEQLATLRKGAAEIIREDELRAKLERSRASGTPLRIKLGVDPTAPDLHLGHTVVLRKLKHFQDEGHTAIFLVGDFTAMVGDPTGQSETRPPLSPEQVQANAETYLTQVYKILDRERTEVRYNSEWLGKLASQEIVKLCGHYRLARMLEREDFRSRLANSQPISVHELLYPLFQAYDSVVLKADVELGATEQKFNLLVGRDIQQEYGQSPQVTLTMPILVGLDGQRKMSKSLGNYVGITELPSQMFGKLMSIPDNLMRLYNELLTNRPEGTLTDQDLAQRPMDAKMELAREIIAPFHGAEAAQRAADEFQRVFRERQAPEEVSVRKLARSEPKRVSVLLVELELAPSRSEAERLIKQGGVEINGERAADVKKELDLSKAGDYLVRAGKKKFLRLVVD
jgi:tyrosyl-tRNA synthetase